MNEIKLLQRIGTAAVWVLVLLCLLLFWVSAARASGDMAPPPNPPVAPAQEEEAVPPEHRITVERCSAQHQACIVTIEELANYIRGRVALAKKLEEMSASKGCAKLEVAPRAKELLKQAPLQRGGKS